MGTSATQPYLVPVMNPRQRWIFRGLTALWLGALVSFWAWWLRAEHWVTPFGMAVNSLLVFWATLLPGWSFFFVRRMQRPNPALPLGRFRTAIIVTKAPSEPWPVVRQTLEGMLRQDYPHPYDTWLADEAPTAATLRWCRTYGVKVSSREGVAAYHRATWPRRTKCKEGNLAYFYDHWGYRDYDVVVQLDADHVPTRGYLREMVRPFADPGVGYVAAPSVCDQNRGESWAVRGRLYKEAHFHGAQQAGYNGGYAPVCIGSHYAMRTAALKQIGGIGPELAEDFTTSLMLNGCGWRGVFALDAAAHGDGPASFADYLVQEFQWSRSLTNVLLGIGKDHWGGLTARKKVSLGFNLTWYPLYALHLLVAFLCPILALLTRTPWVSVPLLEFFVRWGAVVLTSLAAAWWLRRQGWLRPRNSKLWCWETVLFELTKWPWVLWGVTQAVAGRLLHRQFAFKVTPKGVTGPQPLPLVTLLPYLTIAVGSALATIGAGDPGAARGYYYFCLFNALAYLVVTAAVILLHVRENRTRLATPPARFAGSQIAAAALAAIPVAVALALRGGDAFRTLVPAPYAEPALMVMTERAGALRDTLGSAPLRQWWVVPGLGLVLLVVGVCWAIVRRGVPTTGARRQRPNAVVDRAADPVAARGGTPAVASPQRQALAAAATSRPGRLEATINYGSGKRSTVLVRFDPGGGQRAPRLRLTPTGHSAPGGQSVEYIVFADRTWRRQPNGRWAMTAHRHDLWDQVQAALSQAGTDASLGTSRSTKPTLLRWYDADHAADVTLRIDSIAGLPQHLRLETRVAGEIFTITTRETRVTGAILAITHGGWSLPTDIAAPLAS